jgi:hypothetical protein
VAYYADYVNVLGENLNIITNKTGAVLNDSMRVSLEVPKHKVN